jgi:hypothetical protein
LNDFVDLDQVNGFLEQLTNDFENQYHLDGSKRVIFNTFVNLFTYTLQKFKTIEHRKNPRPKADKELKETNADNLIENYRPLFAELLNIIAYTCLDGQ